MTKVATYFIVGFVILLACITATIVFQLNRGSIPQQSDNEFVAQKAPEVRRETPNTEWEFAFFQALERRTKKVNLSSLRSVVLPENDLEVRFWYDARPDIINGFVIRRSGDQWSAIVIYQTDKRQNSPVKQEFLAAPKSGWQAAWQKLVSAGILTLSNSLDKKCHPQVLDGAGYVIETNVNGDYRTYRYSNPQFAECDEAKQILLIEETIADEFNLYKYRY